jgi:hypothetical protein
MFSKALSTEMNFALPLILMQEVNKVWSWSHIIILIIIIIIII